MKVSIIGGGGLVGSSTAFALQCGGVVSSICLIEARPVHQIERFYAGDISEVATSQAVVITAGLRRKPDESRLDLINRNVDLFSGILDQMKSAGLKENTYVIV